MGEPAQSGIKSAGANYYPLNKPQSQTLVQSGIVPGTRTQLNWHLMEKPKFEPFYVLNILISFNSVLKIRIWEV